MRLTTRWFAGLGLIACVGAFAGGCGARGVPPDVVTPPGATGPSVPADGPETPADIPAIEEDLAACEVLAGGGQRVATIALTETVDPTRAPYATNESERLLFRQLYETLVRIDCEGRIRPGLAAAWDLDADGRTWRVTLREGSSFADSTPVTAMDVVTSWMRAGTDGVLPPEANRHIASVAAIDDRVLAIVLRHASATPRVLSDASLAVVKRSPGSIWPLGTRHVIVDPDVTTTERGRSVMTLTAAPDGRDESWSLRVLVAPGHDPRDFLDEGIDLLQTRDPATLDYAGTLPQYARLPLAWARTRVFASRWRNDTTPPLPPEARRTLAADAVRGDARGAEGPFWWDDVSACEVASRTGLARLPATATGRLVYERDDDASRDVAERLIGLAAIPNANTTAVLGALAPGLPRRLYQRATGLSGEALREAQGRGDDSGYLLSFDRRPLDPCVAWAAAVDRIGWLRPEAIVPIIDTRLWVVARGDRSGVSAEWDGGLLVDRGEGR